MPLLITASVFIAVGLLVAVILYPLLSRRSIVQERLDKMTVTASEKPSIAPAAEKSQWRDFLARVGS